jgi:hypothetical protein
MYTGENFERLCLCYFDVACELSGVRHMHVRSASLCGWHRVSSRSVVAGAGKHGNCPSSVALMRRTGLQLT